MSTLLPSLSDDAIVGRCLYPVDQFVRLPLGTILIYDLDLVVAISRESLFEDQAQESRTASIRAVRGIQFGLAEFLHDVVRHHGRQRGLLNRARKERLENGGLRAAPVMNFGNASGA